jgi:hypothetical protein
MKYRVKEIDTSNFVFNKTQLNNGTIVNIRYLEEILEFQSPKMVIHELVKENDHQYITLQLLGTQACKTFYLKIMEIENHFNKMLGNDLTKSVFHENFLTVKIPFKGYSNPLIKVYRNDALFNYYHLTVGMEILCLLCIDKIWINNFNEPNYYLNVKEIMVI